MIVVDVVIIENNRLKAFDIENQVLSTQSLTIFQLTLVALKRLCALFCCWGL